MTKLEATDAQVESLQAILGQHQELYSTAMARRYKRRESYFQQQRWLTTCWKKRWPLLNAASAQRTIWMLDGQFRKAFAGGGWPVSWHQPHGFSYTAGNGIQVNGRWVRIQHVGHIELNAPLRQEAGFVSIIRRPTGWYLQTGEAR